MQPTPTVKASKWQPAAPAAYYVCTWNGAEWVTVAGYLTEQFALDYAAVLTALGQTAAVFAE